MSAHHITDGAALVLASTGLATTMLPIDYAALGVALCGGIIGGFISVAMIPESPHETRRTRATKWAVASLTSICFSPFLFEYWTQSTDHAGVETGLSLLPPTAAAMLALSTAIGFVAWVSLWICQAAWEKWLRKRFLPDAPPLPCKDDRPNENGP